MADFFEDARKYGLTGTPDPPKNSLDKFLDEAQKDLDLERDRHNSIINSENPQDTLRVFQSTENSVKDEDPIIQQTVLKSAYGQALPKTTDPDREPLDQLVNRYFNYQNRYDEIYSQQYTNVKAQKEGVLKSKGGRKTMRGESWEYPDVQYTDRDFQIEADKLTRDQLTKEGLLKPTATGLTYLKKLFTDWKEVGKKLPYIGGGFEAEEAYSLMMAINALKKGTADEDDIRLLIEYKFEADRDKGVSHLATEIFMSLPAYAFEIGTTGGIYTSAKKTGEQATKKAIQKTFEWVLKKNGGKALKNQALKFGINTTAKTAGVALGSARRVISPKLLVGLFQIQLIKWSPTMN